MASAGPDGRDFAAEARSRKARDASELISGVLDELTEKALRDSCSAIAADGFIVPEMATRVIHEINAYREIAKRVRKVIRDGDAASERLKPFR